MRRTQVYLTDEQIEALQRTAARRRLSMAELIRQALDAFLKREAAGDPDQLLESTLGALPGLEVPPRTEWERRTG
jgi:hypothetical protein